MPVHGSHDPVLVVLSILIAVAAAYTALDLAQRTRAAEGWSSHGWLAAAALAMGGGIWSMHFVGMLAFGLHGLEVAYAPGLTALSVMLAIGATGIAFVVVRLLGTGPAPIAVSGAFMGSGIVAMHLAGMAAMRMPASLGYDPAWLLVSVAVAIGASVAALWLAFKPASLRLKPAAGLVMGVAISGMHYAAMTGTTFTPFDGARMAYGASIGNSGLALGVTGATFVILFFALVAAMFDRRFAELAQREATALRRSEEAFRELYRRTPLPLIAVDEAERIEEASDAWLDLLGYRREEVVGRKLAAFLASPAGPEAAPSPSLGDLPAASELRNLETRLVTRSGAALDVLISARAEQDGEGGFRRTLCGLVDVTAHRRAEEALRQSQKMEALGQITGGVAHDFNNMLAVVVGNLNRLQKRLGDDPEALRLARNALHGALRGVDVTQRMLSFARQQRLEAQTVAVPDLVAGMEDLLRQSLGPSIRMAKEVAPDLPPIDADAGQLEVALLNLAVNGRDAMPGGGTLTIRARSVEVAPGAARDLEPGRYVCLAVRDDGDGMDPETLARARDPFFTTKPLGKGTGLGLSMVHGFAEQSGGALRLLSRKGEGSAAEIWLPAAPDATESVASPPDMAEPASPRRLRVMAVDDDPLVLMNTVAMLEELDHSVIEASSAPEALAMLRDGAAIDLVVTDQGMPEMTGLQLAEAIRRDWKELRVLLATGYSDLPEAGTYEKLGKPFGLDELAAAIERAVGSGGSATRAA